MVSAESPMLAVITGPTAGGKSALAMAVAERIGGTIINADASQLYADLRILSARPSGADEARVPHLLYGVLDGAEAANAARWAGMAKAAIAEVRAQGRVPMLVGGTGLYLQAITDDLEIPARFPDVRIELEAEPDTAVLFARLEGLDPLAASRMEPTNRRRVVRALEVTLGSGRPFSSFGPGLEEYPSAPFPVMGLAMEREVLDQRIAQRYEQQMADGFLAEVQTLVDRPAGLGRTARQALGYAELLDHIENGTPLGDALETAVTRTRRFARRQQRWFGRDPRIHWIPTDGEVSANALAELARGLID